MKKIILLLLIISPIFKTNASEYYGLIVGYHKGAKVIKGTCRAYPLNTFIHILEKKKEIAKYFPKDKLDYIKFKTLGQTDNDDFYYGNKSKPSKKDLKNPKLLGDYLANLYYIIKTKQKELIKNKIFKDTEEIENFSEPILTLIGILETMTENNCTEVSWVAKLY